MLHWCYPVADRPGEGTIKTAAQGEGSRKRKAGAAEWSVRSSTACKRGGGGAMSRDETIANFQAITGMEDVSECVALLEEHNWNLETAAAVALSQVRLNRSSSPKGLFVGVRLT